MDNEQTHRFIVKIEKEAKALRDEALRMCWWMRGGINYDQIMCLSPAEKETIIKFIDENIETTKKTGLSVF